jgi:predicted secreted hydrolase
MKQIQIYNLLATLVAAMVIAAAPGCNQTSEPERIDIAEILSSTQETDCFDKADAPIIVQFPRDRGSHDRFKTEWWYYTGNLKTDDDRHFGYQLTFFRQALSCEPISGKSKWRTRHIYFAHFAVTDTKNDNFYSDFRMNRRSLDIAGTTALPFRVWIDDWQLRQVGKDLLLFAKTGDITLTLKLTDEKQPVLQGSRGFSKKGPKPFNSSYYYSIPRLDTAGTLTIGSYEYNLKGKTWFDHEWSTSVLDDEIKGWDWFSVHFEDGRDLMVCNIRRSDGSPNGFGFSSLVYKDGSYEILSEEDFSIRALHHWTSPETGNHYPSRWAITIPDHKISLTVTPVVENQEHTHMMVYWEGAARFIGKDIKGLGYIELTGYEAP